MTGDHAGFLVWHELEAWSKKLAPWQRWIVAKATDHRTLDQAEIDGAYRLLLRDTGLGTSDDEPLPSLVPASARSSSASGDRWVMKEISALRNVNALPETARLPIGERLTVVYGKNGAGKSGFVRLLSQACVSRAPLEILPNVYATPNGPADAVITLSGPRGEERVAVAASRNHPGLAAFTVFDSHVARVQLAEDNTLAFTPAGMDVFREMSRVYGVLGDRLRGDIGARSVAFDFVGRLGSGLQTTQVAAMINAARESLDLAPLRGVVSNVAADQVALEECRKKLAELSTSAIAAKRQQLQQQRGHLHDLHGKIGELRAVVGVEARRELREKMARFAACLALAASEGAAAFRESGLRAVGTPEWTHFVASAAELAKAEGTADHDYPSDGAPCLLCHRPLDEPTATLLRRMWGALATPARDELAALNRVLDDFLAKVERAETNLLPDDSATRAHLAEGNPELLGDLEAFLTSAEALRAELVAAVRDRGGIAERELKAPVTALTSHIARLVDDEKALDATDPRTEAAALATEQRELEARLAVAPLMSGLEDFVRAEAWCKKARGVITADLNTKGVSTKERELSKRVIEGAYLERLTRECETLNCDPPDFETRGQKGQTVRSLTVGRHKPHRVLSEGEQKALALADFLTEVGLDPSRCGIILDDPVTSMDHERKATIAARLAREANERQVVVFTHDLVFLSQLVKAADDAKIDRTTHWIQRTDDGQPGRVVHDDAPTSSQDYETTNPAKASLAMAKAASGSARTDAVRAGMGKLRRTLEEIVVKYMFKGTVTRWNDQIKIAKIPTVAWSEQLADEINSTFEELSRFVEGHSHSEELATPPEAAELATMIVRVEGIVAKARAKRGGR